ncbi:hypothetical protein L1887_18134 [Cichorium endivia]|nr:hypothetical protein L1887_18129 [Cichorium endivia]KAI3510993.1 hypothetical protein L1887_18134 [Cichorium endivia]
MLVTQEINGSDLMMLPSLAYVPLGGNKGRCCKTSGNDSTSVKFHSSRETRDGGRRKDDDEVVVLLTSSATANETTPEFAQLENSEGPTLTWVYLSILLFSQRLISRDISPNRGKNPKPSVGMGCINKQRTLNLTRIHIILSQLKYTYYVLLFGSFSEDEVKSWLNNPSKNTENPQKNKTLDLDSLKITSGISFGSFNGEAINNQKQEALVHPKENGGQNGNNGNMKQKPIENTNSFPSNIPSKIAPTSVAQNQIQNFVGFKEEKLNNNSDGILKDLETCLLPRGLINSGNTCFLNATLQALLSCSLVVQLSRDKEPKYSQGLIPSPPPPITSNANQTPPITSTTSTTTIATCKPHPTVGGDEEQQNSSKSFWGFKRSSSCGSSFVISEQFRRIIHKHEAIVVFERRSGQSGSEFGIRITLLSLSTLSLGVR